MSFQSVWYSPKAQETSPDTIHQILMYGSLGEFTALKKSIGEIKIKEAFLNYPKKIYNNLTLNFITKYLLNITSNIDEQRYLKSSSRNTG